MHTFTSHLHLPVFGARCAKSQNSESIRLLPNWNPIIKCGYADLKNHYFSSSLLVKKMTLFSKLHQKVSKNAKISKNAILKNCGELNSKQNWY